MSLETWDARRKKWQLYTSTEAQAADARRHHSIERRNRHVDLAVAQPALQLRRKTRAQRELHPRALRAHRLDDRVQVLADHHRHPPRHRQRHPPAAIDLALGCLGQLPDAGIAGDVGESLATSLDPGFDTLYFQGDAIEGDVL